MTMIKDGSGPIDTRAFPEELMRTFHFMHMAYGYLVQKGFIDVSDDDLFMHVDCGLAIDNRDTTQTHHNFGDYTPYIKWLHDNTPRIATQYAVMRIQEIIENSNACSNKVNLPSHNENYTHMVLQVDKSKISAKDFEEIQNLIQLHAEYAEHLEGYTSTANIINNAELKDLGIVMDDNKNVH